jgi:hypothetical protein
VNDKVLRQTPFEVRGVHVVDHIATDDLMVSFLQGRYRCDQRSIYVL